MSNSCFRNFALFSLSLSMNWKAGSSSGVDARSGAVHCGFRSVRTMFDSPHPPAFFEPLIDSEHAAALIQVHPKTLQRYARKGIVAGLRVGKLWRFRASELMARRPEEYYEALDEDAQAQ
jgi:hypothetical protein